METEKKGTKGRIHGGRREGRIEDGKGMEK
jgi:hypothetical protein